MGISLKYIPVITLMSFLLACGNDKSKIDNHSKKKEAGVVIAAPPFNADSAYYFIEKQVEFGPRVPGTKKHADCADWIVSKLDSFVDTVIVQGGEVTTYTNLTVDLKNIIGSINPKAKQRILLCAHWDTRPFADQDSKNKDQAILGANDGASGVGVLLEVARQLKSHSIDLGIDIVFFDVEDFGKSGYGGTDTWCLGSQYWARNPHVKNYKARYGILLDMVGGESVYFTKEGNSVFYASRVIDKIWKVAKSYGHNNYFGHEKTDPIIDDHYYVNDIAKIPTVDLIHFDRYSPSHFGPFWHTHKDNMNIIDKGSLFVVGQTVLGVVLNENATLN